MEECACCSCLVCIFLCQLHIFDTQFKVAHVCLGLPLIGFWVNKFWFLYLYWLQFLNLYVLAILHFSNMFFAVYQKKMNLHIWIYLLVNFNILGNAFFFTIPIWCHWTNGISILKLYYLQEVNLHQFYSLLICQVREMPLWRRIK